MLARRAKSYSDFYDVVRAHIRKEYKQERNTHKKRVRQHLIRTDVDFSAWYNGVKGDLLYASHEEYQYAPPTALGKDAGADTLRCKDYTGTS